MDQEPRETHDLDERLSRYPPERHGAKADH